MVIVFQSLRLQSSLLLPLSMNRLTQLALRLIPTDSSHGQSISTALPHNICLWVTTPSVTPLNTQSRLNRLSDHCGQCPDLSPLDGADAESYCVQDPPCFCTPPLPILLPYSIAVNANMAWSLRVKRAHRL